MTPDQAVQAGKAFARAHLELIEGFYGTDAAVAYANGLAAYTRDLMRDRIGEKDTFFCFFCLGQDAITQPEGA
jgi:hypothetical protein